MTQWKLRFISAFVVISLFFALSASARMVTTTWGGDVEKVYNTGFMNKLMKNPNGGISLFNMELIQNDAPGAGRDSEKGIHSDFIWGKLHARKILNIEDPRAFKPWLVIITYLQGKYPLKYKINGNPGQFEDSKIKNPSFSYRWTEFPAEWLKKGKNVIELSCPEASTEEDGWEIWLSRADEYEEGGGDPAHVGETSFKSSDGGETWKESPFGPLGKTRAEYSVRLSLDRYVRTGWLASPVIDLWKGDSQDFIIPQREIQKMKLTISADVPDGTKVDYYFRKGTVPQPFSDEWEQYQLIGNGTSLDFEIGGADLNRRYVQFKAVLSTENPLKSPVIKSADVTAELNERVPLHGNIFVVEAKNPPIKYSSIKWEWEPWDRPEFQELRERENLDEVIAGSRTQFDAQVKLIDYVAKRWRHMSPFPEFTSWDALTILNRIESAGGGGYCLMFNNLLAGMCMAYGWQARHVSVAVHEICEVWNDDFGKWIYIDSDYVNHYNYSTVNAEPLNMFDLHRMYLDYFYPDKKIDWMHDSTHSRDAQKIRENRGEKPPVKRGSLSNHNPPLSGFLNAAYMRMVPRNNWYEKPYPRPLNLNGYCSWDSFINLYDDRTPPLRQFSWYTDRPRDMWPDLNKVHVDATQGFGNDRLFLRFETYTPNFSHFEVNVDDTGWKKVGERWTWLLQSGRNNLRVRVANMLGAKGYPSKFVLNHADAPFAE